MFLSITLALKNENCSAGSVVHTWVWIWKTNRLKRRRSPISNTRNTFG